MSFSQFKKNNLVSHENLKCGQDVVTAEIGHKGQKTRNDVKPKETTGGCRKSLTKLNVKLLRIFQKNKVTGKEEKINDRRIKKL